MTEKTCSGEELALGLSISSINSRGVVLLSGGISPLRIEIPSTSSSRKAKTLGFSFSAIGDMAGDLRADLESGRRHEASFLLVCSFNDRRRALDTDSWVMVAFESFEPDETLVMLECSEAVDGETSLLRALLFLEREVRPLVVAISRMGVGLVDVNAGSRQGNENQQTS